MADLPRGASGLLLRDYKGTKADRLVIRIDPGVISLLAVLCAHEQQAAQELGQWKTHHEERRVIDALRPAGSSRFVAVCKPGSALALKCERCAGAAKRFSTFSTRVLARRKTCLASSPGRESSPPAVQ